MQKLKSKYGEVEAFKYCDVVFNSDFRTAIKTQQGCLRFLKKLDEQTEDSRFKFDVREAERINNFTRKIMLRKKKEYFDPALYQSFILQQTAWRDSKGHRMYEQFYVSMGRKQGKSYLLAILVLYEFLLGRHPEINKEMLLTSRNEEQAKIMYGMVTDMLKSFIDRGVKDKSGKPLKEVIRMTQKTIENLEDGARIFFKSSEADGIDGGEPDIGVMDEYALMRDGRGIKAAIKSGQASIESPLLLMLSTVGENLNSDMYTEYGLVTKILNGDYENDKYFIYIAELEDLEEWKDKENWTKANPLLIEEDKRELFFERIGQGIKDDIEAGHSLNKILTKQFNVWGKGSEDRYIKYQEWEDNELENYDKRGKKVYVGIDLSERTDLTGVSFVYEDSEFIYVDTHSFIAGLKSSETSDYLSRRSTRDEFDYLVAEREGDITISEELINYRDVWSYILDYVKEYDLYVEGMYFDIKLSDKFFSVMPEEAKSMRKVVVAQTSIELAETITDFRDSLREGRIKHSNNMFMNYCIKNAGLKEYNSGGKEIVKPRQTLRIDALDATINAYYDLVGYNFEEQGETAAEAFLRKLNEGRSVV